MRKCLTMLNDANNIEKTIKLLRLPDVAYRSTLDV